MVLFWFCCMLFVQGQPLEQCRVLGLQAGFVRLSLVCDCRVQGRSVCKPETVEG